MKSNTQFTVDSGRSPSVDSCVRLLCHSTLSFKLSPKPAILFDFGLLGNSKSCSAPIETCTVGIRENWPLKSSSSRIEPSERTSQVTKGISLAPSDFSGSGHASSERRRLAPHQDSAFKQFVPIERSDPDCFVLLNCCAVLRASWAFYPSYSHFKTVSSVLTSQLQYPYATFLMACFRCMNSDKYLVDGRLKSDNKMYCTLKNITVTADQSSSRPGSEGGLTSQSSFKLNPVQPCDCLTNCQLNNHKMGNPEEADDGYHSGEFCHSSCCHVSPLEPCTETMSFTTDLPEYGKAIVEGSSSANGLHLACAEVSVSNSNEQYSNCNDSCAVAEAEELSSCNCDLTVNGSMDSNLESSDDDDDDDDDEQWQSDSDEEQTCSHSPAMKSAPKRSFGSSFFTRASTSDDSDSTESSSDVETGKCHSVESDSDWDTDDESDDDPDGSDRVRPDLSCIGELDPFQVSGLYIPSFSATPVRSSSCCSDKQIQSPPVDTETQLSPETARLKSINDKWNTAYNGCQTTQSRHMKQVKFSNEQPSTIPVLNEDVWFDDYQSARDKYWENFALDRSRFRRRIDQTDRDIGWVFNDKHRSKVYQLTASNDSVLRSS